MPVTCCQKSPHSFLCTPFLAHHSQQPCPWAAGRCQHVHCLHTQCCLSSPGCPLTHTCDALTSLQLLVLTVRYAWQGLVKLTLITHKTNCYFSICQAADSKDVKPRVCTNIRSTVILACLSSKQAPPPPPPFKSWSNSQRNASDSLLDAVCDSLRTHFLNRGISNSHELWMVGCPLHLLSTFLIP
jgi:hypothetical protein